MEDSQSDDLVSLRERLQEVEQQESRTGLDHTPISATVRMNIEPVALPLRAVSIAHFVQLLHDEFSTVPDLSKITQLTGESPQDALGAMSRLLDADQILPFKSGFLRYPAREGIKTTEIRELGIGSQTVYATLVGITDEAEYLCEQIVLACWRAAGIEQSWGDLSVHVQLRGYATGTIVNLAVDGSKIVNPALWAELETDVDPRNGSPKYFGYREKELSARQEETRAVMSLDRLIFTVSNQNRISGYAEENRLELVAESKTAANRGSYRILSELPFREHIELVSRIARSISVEIQRSPRA